MTVLERSTPVYIGMRNSCKRGRRTRLRGVLKASCCLKRSDCCLPPTPVYFLEDSRRFYELLSPVLLLLSLTVLQLVISSHPTYFPDIAPSDYHLFRSMSHDLTDHRFQNCEEFYEGI
ncbi:hypothetical protein LAZ67_21001435 [Cordylochernes scorpioides]|uniref:Uncharacterized protein n=1 Tax=Cordylochernes scorpioides TaxID=51811 RepID=A0ABY6LM10_9ARAC|nr:hypothetical protein LAZ67_21001435 [Cordylochernes scorpioides]